MRILTSYAFKRLASDLRVPRLIEALKYAFVRPAENKRFHIASCERNAGESAVRCLESVYGQNYDRRLIRHVFIDDSSTNGTHETIARWLQQHPGHSVDYTHNAECQGGSKNCLSGLRMADPGTIVVQLDGDDWLPDRNVLAFLNKVYACEDVWITYNTTLRYKKDGYRRASRNWHRIPEHVIAGNTFRKIPWCASALRTFRSELLRHVREESLIDPTTGEYWAAADDQAIFYPLLELSGKHCRHINRVTYVYNMGDFKITQTQRDCAERIANLTPYSPLDNL